MNLRRALVLIGVVIAAAVCRARIPAADMLVSNFSSSTITRYSLPSATLTGTHGAGSGLMHPLCARVGPDGKLYVTSEGTNAVLRFDPGTGAFLDTFVASNAGGLTQPTGLDWGPDGSLYVASFDGDSVLKFDGATGVPLGTFVAPGSGALNGADNGMIFGPDGVLYVPSYNNGRVLKYDGATGAFLGTFANIARPRVLIFRGPELLLTSETANAVRRYNAATGAFLGNLVSTHLSVPIGMAFAPDGSLYVASSGNNRIVQFDGTSGAFIRDAATAADGVSLPAFITMVPTPGGVVGMAIVGMLALRRARR